jgi:DNA topoisomerase II
MSDFAKTFVDTFKASSFLEHVKTKGLWAGKTSLINIPDLLGLSNDNEIIELSGHQHVPALLKSIDEVIVNAIDHYFSCLDTRKKVTKIGVTFDKITKVASVYNNGAGIPIVKNSEGCYLIECIFSHFLSGTNIEKQADSIKGGINGIGAKLMNCHSNLFTIETVSNKQKYVQTFKERMSIIEKPVISSTKEEEHTCVTFRPAFEELGYLPNSDYEDDIEYWLRLRLCQASVYVGSKVIVMFNETPVTINDTESLARILAKEDVLISTVAKGPKYNLNITVICSKSKKRGDNMAIINGVISNKGSHINYIRNVIKTYMDTKTAKLKTTIEKKDINIRLVMSGSIPGIDWSGQNKDTLQVSNKILEQYKLQDSFLKQLSLALMDNLMVAKSVSSKEKVEHDKYTKARNIDNAKHRPNCLLLCAEGDSAITLLRTGLTQKCNKMCNKTEFVPSFDWLGIISLQGVVINAAKEVTEYENTEGTVTCVRSDKLKDNKRLKMLVDAFGLDYNCSYSTPEELKTLKYGKLVICTDQDLDGVGKICSLVLVWIHKFWPKLIEHKRVCKLMTPVIRVYNKTKYIEEFYYESELDHWLEHNNSTNMRIKYYKGLATHDSSEAEDMFKLSNFIKNIYTYTLDDVTSSLFNVYFGPDPNLRKKALVVPVRHLTLQESISLKTKQEIPIGQVQLDIDTKLYKNEAINRQLPHAIDGLNPARRKILTASIMRFGQDSKEVKIFQLGGYVADKMLYHHGDMSLNKTIVTMAQSFVGARKYPYLIGIGQFGDRHGSEAGSSRYIYVKLNPIVNLIFPPEDKYLLKYTFDEGIQAEPEYYVPILPMVVLESYQIVTEGWNHRTYGRSLESVVSIVKKYITRNTSVTCNTDRPIGLTIDGNIRLINGVENSFGDYEYDGNVIKIKDLPIGIVTKSYLKNIEKIEYIAKLDDYSSTDEIDIHILLKPGSMDIIKRKYGSYMVDPIEDCFKLKTPLKPNLNYYSCDKAVLECNDYIEAINYWFPVRRDLYKKRLVRREILQRINILKEKQIVRYITMSNELNLSSIEDEDTAGIVLSSNGFLRINSKLLHNPAYINDNLEDLILKSDGSTYDYILDLRERDLTKVSLQKRLNSIEKLTEEYNLTLNHLKDGGTSLWLEEIDTLLKRLKK